jgi:hypothetical protein
MTERTRYRLNVVGDFYVENGCCTICGLPQALAPDLFGEDSEQCYVRKQPTDSTELARMLEVLYGQELGCIRYGGRDLGVIKTIDGWHDTLEIVDAPGWIRAMARAFGREISS